MKKAIAWTAVGLLIVAAALLSGAAQRGGQPGGKPDLIVSNIDFHKVQSGTDSGGKTYWIFNVIIKLKNQGNASAGAFKVLLERNNGAGGAFQTACQTCVLDVPGLGAGQETTLEPRQFNDANQAPSRFRATADSAGQISETNEGNNSREEAFISMSITVAGGGVAHVIKPDLTPVFLDFDIVSQTSVNGKMMMSYRIATVVKNLGPGSSPACLLLFQRGSDPHACVLWNQQPVPALAAGAQAVVLSSLETIEMGTPGKWYDVYVDINHEVSEANEDNNYLPAKQLPYLPAQQLPIK